MKIQIISQLINGEEIPINAKGCEEVEMDIRNDMTAFSLDKSCRYIGLGKNLYRMSKASYVQLKKQLQKTNQIYMFDNSKR